MNFYQNITLWICVCLSGCSKENETSNAELYEKTSTSLGDFPTVALEENRILLIKDHTNKNIICVYNKNNTLCFFPFDEKKLIEEGASFVMTHANEKIGLRASFLEDAEGGDRLKTFVYDLNGDGIPDIKKDAYGYYSMQKISWEKIDDITEVEQKIKRFSFDHHGINNK